MITTKDGATELAAGMQPLVPDWIIVARDDYDKTIDITLPCGGGLHMHLNPYNHAGRVVIRGSYPQGTWSNKRVGAITVALARGPEAIVKEIKRRLLPEYLPSFAAASRAEQESLAYQARCTAALKELADVLGVAVYRDGQSAYYYRDNISAEVRSVHDTSASLELSVPQELAKIILALVVQEVGRQS